MEKIQVKTKIKLRTKIGKREIVILKKLDMTSRQVSSLDKLIYENQDEHVRMTINADKSLELPDIVSNVHLLRITSAVKGRTLLFEDFRTPKELIETIESYIENETEVTITIEQLQEELFDDPSSSKDSDATGDKPSDEPKDIQLKLPPKWGAKCFIKIGKVGEYWQYGFIIKIGNVESSSPFDASPEYDDANDCTMDLLKELGAFIDAQENFKQQKPLKKKIESAVEKWMLENN